MEGKDAVREVARFGDLKGTLSEGESTNDSSDLISQCNFHVTLGV